MDYNLSFPFYLLIYFVYFIMINYSTYFGIPFFFGILFPWEIIECSKSSFIVGIEMETWVGFVEFWMRILLREDF